jgi:hypothetical protein
MPGYEYEMLSHIMRIEEPDPESEKQLSLSESKMSRRRAISFLAGSALCAAVLFYFGFPSSPGVSADSSGDNSTSTSQSTATTPESSTTTTARPGGGSW